MGKLKILHIVCFILIIVGGLNWGLVGAFHYNLVMALFGSMPALENLIYVLVGLAAVVEVATHKSNCKACTVPKQ